MFYHRASHQLPVLLALAASFVAPMKSAEPERFESLRSLIRPQPDESRWAEVSWEINLKRARERAAREDKPLLLWRSGGGDVLGRT